MSFQQVDLISGMPDRFTMPIEFLELAAWATQIGNVQDGYGYLADPRIGEHCLVTMGDPARTSWAGYLVDPDRLWFIAATGGEGSSVCLWLDDDGRQHVVHHGSGSGSILFAVLPSPLAVLRLFAVGYEEPCWNTDWGESSEQDGAAPARTGIEALGLEDVADQWIDVNGPANDPFLQWLDGPGTVVRN